jgi:hypothetical protein
VRSSSYKGVQIRGCEIQKAGWEALKKELGLVGALRFLLQYEKGEGDYTKLRRKFFRGETVKNLTR